jgi:5-hydroxyisourate hydrolase
MGRLTTHVLDTARGRPGAGMRIEVFASGSPRRHLKTTLTNAEGRCDTALLEGESLRLGSYEIDFHAGAYFRASGVTLADPPFLDVVTVRVGIANADAHYHVPLLVSPWSYTTYRGS